MPFVFLLSLVFLCCHNDGDHEAHFEKVPSDKLKEKASLYCDLSRPGFEARKWAVSECDGLLFTSLRGIGCGDVDITVFEDGVEPGKWYRDPAHGCFIADKVGDQGSDSTISKDMYIGLISYLYENKDSNALGRSIEYAQSRSWVVGEAKDATTLASKCYLTPTLQALIKDAFASLGGQMLEGESDDSIGVQTGFQAHLQVLGIMLRGKIDGHISSFDLGILKDQARRQPNNALFQAAKARYDDGDFSQTEALLLAVDKFPENSLPNNHDNYCTEYLYQRDESPDDWAPCPQSPLTTYDGTDFIFAAAVYTSRF